MTQRMVTQIRQLQHHVMLMLSLTILISAQGGLVGAPGAEAQTGDSWSSAGTLKMQTVNLHMSGDASVELPGTATQ